MFTIIAVTLVVAGSVATFAAASKGDLLGFISGKAIADAGIALLEMIANASSG